MYYLIKTIEIDENKVEKSWSSQYLNRVQEKMRSEVIKELPSEKITFLNSVEDFEFGKKNMIENLFDYLSDDGAEINIYPKDEYDTSTQICYFIISDEESEDLDYLDTFGMEE